VTAQIHERLILDGEETTMACCPPIPRHPRILPGDPHAHRTDDGYGVLRSTACWRRYLGTWEIKEGRFYLVALRGIVTLSEGEPILADWFSGSIVVPRGELIEYVHMGFASTYERDLHIEIDRGVVVKSWIVDNISKVRAARDQRRWWDRWWDRWLQRDDESRGSSDSS
jgi:hypothetical protein